MRVQRKERESNANGSARVPSSGGRGRHAGVGAYPPSADASDHFKRSPLQRSQFAKFLQEQVEGGDGGRAPGRVELRMGTVSREELRYAKEPYIARKRAPYCPQKSPTSTVKKPYITSKEPYIHPK